MNNFKDIIYLSGMSFVDTKGLIISYRENFYDEPIITESKTYPDYGWYRKFEKKRF